MLIFVTGGVRSGKSTFAEQVVSRYVLEDHKAYYVATSAHIDQEMRRRVQKHRDDRERDSLNWTTIEQPRNLHELAGEFQFGDVVLLDCLTNLLNNELFEGWDMNANNWIFRSFRKNIYDNILKGINELMEADVTLVIVSNEVFFDPLPVNEDGTYYYVELLGKLHQAIVEKAEIACLVENGTPIFMKRSITHADRTANR
ncbi:hypothetical protein ABE41_016190 [Fictibacillus arsenicus]|uniref:Adenosylcobinamide kinase n=1 Tax=Fictibacillus arsenicus TaxID=255247 RepID=A0A1B1Z824_9BACL|nr:bifunctional adenosylcobinamide kinase/adenosylcobinamide-phosphate guanylyltransferase [Fictibacillus arsenicus]ANX13551.1 hypothetical protein ABE41_016190 [Fictibacillus arsenicus]